MIQDIITYGIIGFSVIRLMIRIFDFVKPSPAGAKTKCDCGYCPFKSIHASEVGLPNPKNSSLLGQ